MRRSDLLLAALRRASGWGRPSSSSPQQHLPQAIIGGASCRFFVTRATPITRMVGPSTGGFPPAATTTTGAGGPMDPAMLKKAMSMSSSDFAGLEFTSDSRGGSNTADEVEGGEDGEAAPRLPGTSDEDAFGELDPMQAIENAARVQRERRADAETEGEEEGGDGEEEDGQDADDDVEGHAAGSLDVHPATASIVKKSRKKTRKGKGKGHMKRKNTDGEEETSSSALSSAVTDIATVAASEAITEQSKSRRHRRRRRSVDTILGDVLHDALKLRDMGHKPTADFVYKRSQERMYEEEYGQKPPSAKDHAVKYIPFPPDLRLHRLLPLEKSSDNSSSGNGVTDEETPGNTTRYSKNYMHTYRFLPEDPWPERAITRGNPVWTKRMVAEDAQKTSGAALKDWERRMYAPRSGYDVAGEFCDGMDELAYWEAQLLLLLRGAPLSQRRSLPYLHEFYRMYVHRAIRAEKRFIAARNAALTISFRPSSSSSSSGAPAKTDEQKKEEQIEEILHGDGTGSLAHDAKAAAAQRTPGGKNFFNRTEESVERIRAIYAEAHRSLSSPNYDPVRMKKSALAPFMKMTDVEFQDWQNVQKQRRNAIIAELS